jgi:hypothetical protein
MKQILLLFAFVLGGVALHAQGSKPDLTVYPNPATEYIFVQDNNDAVSEVLIFNLIGKKVKVFTYNKGEQFYVADLAKGMYLVQLIDHNKHILTTQKLEKR